MKVGFPEGVDVASAIERLIVTAKCPVEDCKAGLRLIFQSKNSDGSLSFRQEKCHWCADKVNAILALANHNMVEK